MPPLDWQKGDQVIIPPPKTLEEMQQRLEDTSCERVDFYLCKKDLVIE